MSEVWLAVVVVEVEAECGIKGSMAMLQWARKGVGFG
jgi:hypothetical protein